MSLSISTEDLTDDGFMTLVEPMRGELTAHCYRMLGSVHDAEDLVQETYLRAWRSYDGFENRSSLRTWMYRIATNVCLTALKGARRRPLPTGLGQPAADPHGTLQSRPETPWLEPLPDSMVWGGRPEDPAAEVVGRETVRLAFVAALQHLTPQQRAILLLRDVLAWQASEVAQLLELSTAAVNSTLQRARAHLLKLDPEQELEPVTDEVASRMLTDYMQAFADYDVPRIVELLTLDARWEMPPFEEWYSGAEAIGELIRTHCPAERAGDQVMVRVQANGAPALALYMRQPDDSYAAFQIQLPTVTAAGICYVAAFFDTDLFARFGLPDTLTS